MESFGSVKEGCERLKFHPHMESYRGSVASLSALRAARNIPGRE